jgi:hypothetical protein
MSTTTILATAAALGTLAATALVVTLLIIRRQVGLPLRAVCVAGVVLTLLLAPALVDILVVAMNKASGRARWIDPGLVTMWFPSGVAILAAFATVRSSRMSPN